MLKSSPLICPPLKRWLCGTLDRESLSDHLKYCSFFIAYQRVITSFGHCGATGQVPCCSVYI